MWQRKSLTVRQEKGLSDFSATLVMIGEATNCLWLKGLNRKVVKAPEKKDTNYRDFHLKYNWMDGLVQYSLCFKWLLTFLVGKSVKRLQAEATETKSTEEKKTNYHVNQTGGKQRRFLLWLWLEPQNDLKVMWNDPKRTTQRHKITGNEAILFKSLSCPFTCSYSVARFLVSCPWASLKLITAKLEVNVRRCSSKHTNLSSLAGIAWQTNENTRKWFGRKINGSSQHWWASKPW